MIATVIMLLAVISLRELKSFFKQKEWKTIVVYSVLMLISSGLLVAIMLEVNIPSPYPIVGSVFDPISHVIFPTE